MADFSGQRIAIIGPSGSGKSTLAYWMMAALRIPLLHLDQVAHKPGSNWERVSDQALSTAQDDFIKNKKKWIIEGNYSCCMESRLQQADTVIWCDPPLRGCIWRYILRSVKAQKDRPGGLEGAKQEFNIGLIRYTCLNYPQNRKRYKKMIEENRHLRLIHLTSFSDIKAFGKPFAGKAEAA